MSDRTAFTCEQIDQIWRAQKTVPPGDWEQDIIVFALAVAAAAMRPGVIEEAIGPFHEPEEYKREENINAEVESIRAALTKEPQT